jgi:hypothetical protein
MRAGLIFWLIVALGLSLGVIAYLLQLPPAPGYRATPVVQAIPIIPCQAPVLPDDGSCDHLDGSSRDKCKGRRRI